MPTRFICDVNVWYNAGLGQIDLSRRLGPGDTVAISPLTVFECLATLNAGNFAMRQKAAALALKLGAQILPNTDERVASIVGVTVPQDTTRYGDALKALASATDLQQLQHGVPDWKEYVVRKVAPSVPGVWLSVLRQQWVRDQEAMLIKRVPGYDAYLQLPPAQRGGVPELPDAQKAELKAMFASAEWPRELAKGLVMRCNLVLSGSGKPLVDVATHAVPPSAAAELAVYSAVYAEYLYELQARGLRPKANDNEDLEYLLHVGSGDVFLTCEKLWVRLANQAGVGGSVQNP